MLPWTCLCKFLYEHIFHFSWVDIWEGNCWAKWQFMSNALRNCQPFPKWLYHFTFLPEIYKESDLSRFVAVLVIVCLFYCSPFISGKIYYIQFIDLSSLPWFYTKLSSRKALLIFLFLLFFLGGVLEIKLRALYLLGRHSTAELNPNPYFYFSYTKELWCEITHQNLQSDCEARWLETN